MNIYYDVEDNHYRTYPDGDIATIDQMRELIENKKLSITKLQEENKQLKNNWNELKEWLNNFHKLLSEYEQWEIVNKMQELEKGSDSDE